MRELGLGWLFDAAALAPHGFCLLWEPWLIWSHALADAAIGLAYFSIPVALVVFVRRRRDLVMKPVFWLFAAFILLCGAGHWIDLATIWSPVYRLEAVVKIATALVSVATAVALWPLMPRALALPSPAQLQAAHGALLESEARYRASFLHAPMALHTLDADGLVTGVSDRWLDLLGYTRTEVVGRPIEAFLIADPPGVPASPRAGARDERDTERWFQHSDGTIRDVLVSTRIEHASDAGGPWAIGALIDVTDRNRAEAALRDAEERQRQTQRLEALGQLAGGIAHDFNNVLQVVSGAVSVIEAAPERTDQVKRLAHLAAEAGRRGAKISSRLLAFARRGDLRATAIDPGGLIGSLRELLEPTLGARVRLLVEAPPGLPPLLADRGELETVLVNLATNARDAMPAGGGLTLAATLAPAGELAAQGLPPGDYIRIDVVDTGTGMDARTLARASEPFFTTKPVGQGTGLGLAMARGFAQQSGGALVIESRPGRGTTIRLWLPRAAAPAAVAAPEGGHPASGSNGASLLLVDDEELVRQVLAAGLTAAGFVVTEAASGADALARLRAGLPVAVLVTDLTMPGLDGLRLIDEVRRLRPGLPAILLTGDPGTAAPLGGPVGAPDAFQLLRKPIEPDHLAASATALLAPPRAA